MIKGLKKNEQVKDKMKRKSWNIENSPKARLSESTPVKLSFFSSNSLKQAISRLSEMSLSPIPVRLNRRCKT